MGGLKIKGEGQGFERGCASDTFDRAEVQLVERQGGPWSEERLEVKVVVIRDLLPS